MSWWRCKREIQDDEARRRRDQHRQGRRARDRQGHRRHDGYGRPASKCTISDASSARRELVDILIAKGLRKKYYVILGGAPVKAEWVAEAGADSWGLDAGSAVKVLEQALAEKSTESGS